MDNLQLESTAESDEDPEPLEVVTVKEEPREEDIFLSAAQLLPEECVYYNASSNSNDSDPFSDEVKIGLNMEILLDQVNGVKKENSSKDDEAGPSTKKRKKYDVKQSQGSSVAEAKKSKQNHVPLRKNKTTSNEDRERIIDLNEKGYTCSVIAEMLSLGRTTVHSILKKYFTTGEIEARTRGGVKAKKLNDAAISSIRSWMDEDCTTTMSQVRENLWKYYRIRVSGTTISRELPPFLFCFKRIKAVSKKQENTASTEEDRKQYVSMYNELVQRVSQAAIIFVHVVKLNVNMRFTNLKHPSEASTKQKDCHPFRTRNVVIVCALNRDGIKHYMSRSRSVNQEVFETFVKGLKEKLNEQPEEYRPVLVLDSNAFRECTAISEVVENEGFEVQYLPSNEPLFNPVDYLFSTWKQILKRANPQSEPELIDTIERGASLITTVDCNECFNKMDEYIASCTIKQEKNG